MTPQRTIRSVRRAFSSWPAIAVLATADVTRAAAAVVPHVGSTSATPNLAEAAAAGVASALPDMALRDAALRDATPIVGLEASPELAHWYQSSAPATDDYWVDSEGYYKVLYRRFSLSLGAAAYAKFNTNMQISGAAGVGTNLDMEDLLGLDDSSLVARIDAHYAFNRRHWLMASYYDINRDGTKTIPDDIQVGDVTIPAGSVDSRFDTAIIKLAYRYNFVDDLRTVIGASFGFHVMSLDTAISSNSVDVSESFKVTAPLPLIGLHGAYALGRKWKLAASAEFLQFDVGDYQGLITDTRLTLEHDTFKNFGWGIGFNGFQADAEIQDGDLDGDIEYGYQGLMLYVRMMF